ncbi:MAG: tetratricopeptide repeat protein [Phycisphaerales bacterium]
MSDAAQQHGNANASGAKSGAALPSAKDAASSAKVREGESAKVAEGSGAGWKDVWQVPAMIGAAALLVGGGVYALATRPKADVLVDFKKAQAQMQEKKYAEAVATLSEKVLPILNKGGLTNEQRRGFHLMRARGIYLGQKEAGVDRVENHEAILDEYARAEKIVVSSSGGANERTSERANEGHEAGSGAETKESGATHAKAEHGDEHASASGAGAASSAKLEDQDQVYIAETQLALGQLAKAAARLDQLENSPSEKERLQKAIIEKALSEDFLGGGGKGGANERTSERANEGHATHSGHGTGAGDSSRDEAEQVAVMLLTDLTSNTNLDAQTRLWAVSRQARLAMAQGYPEEAATKLLRTLPRVMQESDPTLQGETLMLLARAYIAQGDLEGAAKQLETAMDVLPDYQDLNAELLTLAGQVAQQMEQPEQAREYFASVLDQFEYSPYRYPAMLGMAEVEFRLAQLESPTSPPTLAISQFQYLVDEYQGLDASEHESDAHVSPVAHEGEQAAKTEHADEHGAAPSKDEHAAADEHAEEKAAPVPPGNASVRKRAKKENLLDRKALTDSILARCRERAEVEDWHSALTLASMVSSLYQGADEKLSPPESMLAKAQSQRRIAEDLLADADGGLRALAEADPATQREARALLLGAGENFREYAERIVKDDANEYADALWQSADCYDMAGDLEDAIRGFLQFSSDFPSDARSMEAKFRLAEAYRARGDLKPAEAQYRDLLSRRDSAGRSGPYADASYVPLSQTLLADEDPANDAEAEQLLQTALSGRVGGVSTPGYRAALKELGEFYAKSGKHEAAIERFEEYLTRVDTAVKARDTEAIREAKSTPLVRFKLADAYRLSARGIDKALEGALPDSDQRALKKTRLSRLNKAFEAYSKVVDALESRERRGPLEDVALRNSFFFRGDCAFEMRDFEEAIRQYDAAKERYPRDPASLVALTQMVSALVEKGDVAGAKVANEKARKFYESLPETVWDDATLPMGKREWERWLAAQTKLIEKPRLAQEGQPEESSVAEGEER